MNDPEAQDSPLPAAPTDSWEGMLANLRRRYPGQKDSVLFCVHKLQQNPDLTLRDFRDEARLYGIPMAGRALHSARMLLGLVRSEPRAPAAKPATAETDRAETGRAGAPRNGRRKARRQAAAAADDEGQPIEQRVLDAVRQIQAASTRETERLRTAVEQAVELLQRALRRD